METAPDALHAEKSSQYSLRAAPSFSRYEKSSRMARKISCESAVETVRDEAARWIAIIDRGLRAEEGPSFRAWLHLPLHQHRCAPIHIEVDSFGASAGR
jgi:hypothetical protein